MRKSTQLSWRPFHSLRIERRTVLHHNNPFGSTSTNTNQFGRNDRSLSFNRNLFEINVFSNNVSIKRYGQTDANNTHKTTPSNELEQHSALLNQSLYERSPIIKVVPDEILEQLPRIKYAECRCPDQNRVCAITYDEFVEDSIIIQLPCNHCFLVEPIINWLSQNSCECPVCRFAMESVEKNNTLVHNVLSNEFTENSRGSVVNNVVVGTNNDGSVVDNSGIDIMLGFLDS